MAKTAQEAARIEAGLQCPECFGPHVEARYIRFVARPDRFECRECGCTWRTKLEAAE